MAVLVPIIVELRTALSWFGITLSVFETIVLGLGIVIAVLAWAAWPPSETAEAGSVRSE
ncbi:CbaC protein [Natrinema salsiterrestre]|uniref:CbaC protein n=1 Tax=Natrinema salsiterrestre TaxID=2950540 RepID=A0A9Q4L6P6_9EURY|nr:CbaC protein [Natrinema salsiterrestre]MDF9747552.1 CbaC protein [Natrinema salsiterrestre]